VIDDAKLQLLPDLASCTFAAGEVRLEVGDILRPKRALTSLLHRLKATRLFLPSTVVWIDLGTQPVNDWRAFRKIWETIVEDLGKHNPRPEGLGVAASALLVPGNMGGHFSSEYLASLMPWWARQCWVGLPLDPTYAEFYLASQHIVDSRPMRPLEAFRRLGFRIQGEISDARWTQAVRDGLLTALPGKNNRQRFAAYLTLFPEVERFRIQTANVVHIQSRTSQTKPRVIKSPTSPSPEQAYVRSCSDNGKRSKEIWETSKSELSLADLDRIELMMIVAGEKPAMRTSTTPERWPALQAFLARHNLAWACQNRTARYVIDRGKGGWSNLLDDSSGKRPGRHELFVYIARERGQAAKVLSLEGSDDTAFGAVLGYPECCLLAFKRMFQISLQHQGDLIPVLADQTPGPEPWSFLLNIATRYFGTALLSFYPCSFTCRSARSIALRVFKEIQRVSPRDASAMQRLLAAPILYTEYQGIYAFPDSSWENGGLQYRQVLMTTHNRVGRMLLRGDRINLYDEDRIEIARHGRAIGKIGGTNVRLLRFALED
jgi:hypothetical protein